MTDLKSVAETLVDALKPLLDGTGQTKDDPREVAITATRQVFQALLGQLRQEIGQRLEDRAAELRAGPFKEGSEMSVEDAYAMAAEQMEEQAEFIRTWFQS
jgi:hypothetical protein